MANPLPAKPPTVTANPFALLRVSTSATKGEVMSRGKELMEEVQDKETEAVYQHALEAIINHPLERLVHSLWEMPDTDYEGHDEAWAAFAKAYRVNPADALLKAAAAEFEAAYLTPEQLLKLLAPLLLGQAREANQPLTLPPWTREWPREPWTVADVF